MNRFTPQNHVNGSPQPIFHSKTLKNHAEVGQDKHAPLRERMASGQPVTSEPSAYERTVQKNEQRTAHAPAHTPKRHGSQKRRLIQVYGCVSPDIAESLDTMRDQGAGHKLSMSAVV